ncbi:unnamed protein product, partial [Prorocentrum cordatum]
APQEPELPGDQHANGPAAVVGRGAPGEGANDGGSNSSTEETDHEAEPAQAPAPSNGPTEESWAALGGIDLQQELRRFVPTLQNVPRFLRAETRMAFTTALQRIKRGHDQGNQATTHQGWTLFLLASRLLLSKPKGTDAEGRQELLERAQRFRQGDWLALLHEANTTAGARAAPRPATEEQQQERRREQACAHVRNGNPSRGRQVLTAAAIAPGNGETLNRLRDPARRPPTLSRRLPANLDRATDRARLDNAKFLACLRSAKKGTAAGPSGVRVEHLKPLLEHEESMDLLGFAAAALAEARVPSPIARALALCKMTALQKPDNGDFLVAFLDDVYIKTTRARARAAFDTTTGAIHLHANVDCHLGKCRAYSRGGAAYWGARADALHMLHQRRPVEAAAIRDLLDGTRPGRRGNLAAAAAAAQLLETEGFRIPSWTDLLQGLRPEAPPRSEAAEPGEWQHGWQFHACSARNTHYRDNVFMPSLTRANQAMLRSGSGPRAAYWLHTLPTTEGRVFKPARFLAALRQRLRLPLPLLPHTCGAAGHPGCRARLDTLGDHLAACPRTGLLARRAKPLERAWARVAREAGGRVVPQQLLRDTNAVVHNPLDRRQLDLVVYGISPNGVPLCCDSTMVSPLRRDGWHRPRTFDTDGAALLGAERRKRRRYHELTTGHSGRLMVLSCEVGGRWGRDSLQLVRLLAKQKARAAPALLRRSAELAYTNRWWGFLSVAAQNSLMATLTGDGYLALGGAAGEGDPDLAEVLLADSAGGQGRRALRPRAAGLGQLWRPSRAALPGHGAEPAGPGPRALPRLRGRGTQGGSAGRAAGGGGWRREDRAVAGGPAGPPKATAGVGSPAMGPAGGSQDFFNYVMTDFASTGDAPPGLMAPLSALAARARTADHDLTHLPSDPKCEVCQQATITRAPAFRRAAGDDNVEKKQVAAKDGERFHCDLVGPTAPSLHDEVCAMVTRDDATDYPAARGLRTRTSEETAEKFDDMYSSTTVRAVRTDNGGEFDGEFREMLRARRARNERSLPRRPQTNSRAERFHRTLAEGTRCLMLASGVPYAFWVFCLTAFVFLCARAPSPAGGPSPCERRSDKLCDLSKVRPFGSACFFLEDRDRLEKFEARGTLGVVLGYGQLHSYYVLDFKHYLDTEGEARIVHTRDVKFPATVRYPFKEAETENPDVLLWVERLFLDPVTDLAATADEPGRCGLCEKGATDADPTCRACVLGGRRRHDMAMTASRHRRLTGRDGDEALLVEMEVGSMDLGLTSTQHKMTLDWYRRDYELMGWTDAEQYGVPQLEDATWKARFVCTGNHIVGADGRKVWQVDNLYAAPDDLHNARLVVLHGAATGIVLKGDVKTAYLQAAPGGNATWLRLPKHMRHHLPKRAMSRKDPVVRLLRALYGFPRSGGDWGAHFARALRNAGWKSVEGEKSLWISPCGMCVMVMYVDDLVLGGPERPARMHLDKVGRLVELGRLGPLKRFLCTQCAMQVKGGVAVVVFSHPEYTSLLIEHFKRQFNIGGPLKAAATPTAAEDLEAQCGHETGPGAKHAAMHIGGQLFLARSSRPDILFAVGFVSRYAAKWSNAAAKRLRRIFEYPESTLRYGIRWTIYNKDVHDIGLRVFVDADHGGCEETARSTSRWNVLAVGRNTSALIDWCSRRQGSTAKSAPEAEVVAGADALQASFPLWAAAEDIFNRDMFFHAHVDNDAAHVSFTQGYSRKLI